MNDFALLGLLIIAIAIGFYLGRHAAKKNVAGVAFAPGKSYFQGLNYLLNEQPDKAVEEFVSALDVNTDTLETHLALGKLMRKQGQVDRAIRIHQNLLARPVLELKDQHQVHLELARDFMTAGLLDRAEVLLQEVIGESTVLRSIAQRSLLVIYQDESEWQDAINVAQALLQSRFMKANVEHKRNLQRMVAHFYCELAEDCMRGENLIGARQYLDRAVAADKTVYRVALLSAANDNAQGRHKQVIKVLSRLELQDPAWFWMCLPALQEAYERQDVERGFEIFSRHLRSHIENHDAPRVAMYLVDQFIARSEDEPIRVQQASEILSVFVAQYESLLASNKLVELQINDASKQVESDVCRLHAQVSDLLNQRNRYRCGDCGFSGRQLHWRCPSCKTWESMRSIENQSTI